MVRHVLVLDKTIRLGHYLGNVVGPFDTVEAAELWYENAKRTWKIAPPNTTCTTLLNPED